MVYVRPNFVRVFVCFPVTLDGVMSLLLKVLMLGGCAPTVLQSVLVQDLAAYVFSTIGSLLWVYMFRELTRRQMFDQV